MPSFLRTPFLALGLLFAASLAGFTLLHGCTGWDPTLADLAWEVRREDALDQRLQSARGCSAGKEEVVAELIADRLTLGQAADRFGRLNVRVKHYDGPDVRAAFHVASRAEALYRCVYIWARNELSYRHDPAADEVLARLRAEYRKHFGRDPNLPP
jgi:hypothetical protein